MSDEFTSNQLMTNKFMPDEFMTDEFTSNQFTSNQFMLGESMPGVYTWIYLGRQCAGALFDSGEFGVFKLELQCMICSSEICVEVKPLSNYRFSVLLQPGGK